MPLDPEFIGIPPYWDREEERHQEETIVILSLLVLQEMLFMSKYPPEVLKPLKDRINKMLAKYQAKAVHNV